MMNRMEDLIEELGELYDRAYDKGGREEATNACEDRFYEWLDTFMASVLTLADAIAGGGTDFPDEHLLFPVEVARTSFNFALLLAVPGGSPLIKLSAADLLQVYHAREAL